MRISLTNWLNLPEDGGAQPELVGGVKMNFVIYRSCLQGISNTAFRFLLILVVCFSTFLAGCSDKVRLPSAQELAGFANAGPIGPSVDVDRLLKARMGGGAYRVVPGEVLELTMPTILQVVTAEESAISDKTVPFACRVSETGTITLPVVGEVEAAGKTLVEIELAVIDAYHPKYTVTRPPVFARVLEYKTARVSISGAVQKPGIYSLRSEQMSVVALLMEAGGIVNEGAAVIRIIRSREATESEQEQPQSVSSAAVTGASQTEDRNSTTLPPAKELRTLDTGNGILFGPRSVSSKQIEVQLTFWLLDLKSKKGVVAVVYDGKTQRIKNVDISSELHRQTLVKYLVKEDQRFSTVNLESEFIALAEELRTTVSLESNVASLGEELRVVSASDNTKKEPEKPDLAGKPQRNETEGNHSVISDEVIYRQLSESLNSFPKTGHRDPAKRRTNKPEPLVLPVRGLNIPFADVALEDGDTVIVERLILPLFTVVGLVNKPGNFPYPSDVTYNLMQAIAFAGGFDAVAEPRYATIYRLKADGSIIRAPFQIIDTKKGTKLTEALNVRIKPGDIVAVEHTPRTRTNLFLDRTFRFTIGTYLRLDDIWEDD